MGHERVTNRCALCLLVIWAALLAMSVAGVAMFEAEPMKERALVALAALLLIAFIVILIAAVVGVLTLLDKVGSNTIGVWRSKREIRRLEREVYKQRLLRQLSGGTDRQVTTSAPRSPHCNDPEHPG